MGFAAPPVGTRAALAAWWTEGLFPQVLAGGLMMMTRHPASEASSAHDAFARLAAADSFRGGLEQPGNPSRTDILEVNTVLAVLRALSRCIGALVRRTEHLRCSDGGVAEAMLAAWQHQKSAIAQHKTC